MESLENHSAKGLKGLIEEARESFEKSRCGSFDIFDFFFTYAQRFFLSKPTFPGVMPTIQKYLEKLFVKSFDI